MLLLTCCCRQCLCCCLYLSWSLLYIYTPPPPPLPIASNSKTQTSQAQTRKPKDKGYRKPKDRGYRAPLWLSSQQTTFGGCIVLHWIIKRYYSPHNVLYSVYSILVRVFSYVKVGESIFQITIRWVRGIIYITTPPKPTNNSK